MREHETASQRIDKSTSRRRQLLDIQIKPAGPLPTYVSKAGESSVSDWLFAGLSGWWTDLRSYRWALLWAVLLSLVSRFQSFTTTMYSIDGYEPKSYAHFLEDGRWGLALLFWLREQLGYSGIHVVPSSMFLATLLFATAGLLYARFIFVRPTSAEAFIFMALYTLHPFNTEMYTFSDMTLISAISTVMAAAGLACCASDRKPWLASGAGFVLLLCSLSINQLLLAHIAVVAVLAFIARIVAGQLVITNGRTVAWRLLTPPVRVVIITVTVALFYLATVSVAAHFMNDQLVRADQAQALDIHKKLNALQMAFVLVLLPLEGFRTGFGTDVQFLGLSAATATIFLVTLRRRGIAFALCSVVLIGVAAVCSVAVPVAAKDIWLVPRLLATFSLFIAGIAVLGWHCTAQSWPRRIESIVIAALITGYIGTSNSILYDQHRVNLWDMQEANRIVARLEANPEFGSVRTLAIQNAFWSHPARLPTALGDLNISALYPTWSRVGLIEEATGLQFADPTSPEIQVATRFCDRADIWPARGSTTIIDGLGIVCVGHNPPVRTAPK